MHTNEYDTCMKSVKMGKENKTDGLFVENNFALARTVDVKTSEDSKTAVITGCVFMPNGDIILCDRMNECIKKLSYDFSLEEKMGVQAEPWGLSVVDDNNVIITLPPLRQLQYMQVAPRLKHGRVIELDKSCWGIEVHIGEIYVTCHNEALFNEKGEGEVRVLNLEGVLLRRLGINQGGAFMFQRPYHITVSAHSRKVYVSDAYTSDVTCFAADGNVVYRYANKDPRGDLSWSLGLIVDAEENILVCGNDGNSADIVTAKGKRHKTLHVKAPYDVAYRSSDSTLIFSSQDILHIFKAKG